MKLARPRDWCTSKLPFAAASLMWLHHSQISALMMLACLAIISALAAFGYGLNDLADRGPDRRAGKANCASDLSSSEWSLFLTGTAGAALVLGLTQASGAAAAGFVLAGLALSVLYSAPPVRLKEQGLLGIIAAGAAQWAVPVLISASFEINGWHRLEALCFGMLALMIGLRWMAIHQQVDLQADRTSGVRTYATRGGHTESLVSVAFRVELGLLLTLFVASWPYSIAPILAFGLWLIKQFVVKLRRQAPGIRHPHGSAPLADYYFLLLPVSLAVERAWSELWFVGLVPILVVLGSGQVLRILHELGLSDSQCP